VNLREFAKLALSRQEVARFGSKGMGTKKKRKRCTSKDISDKSVKGTTTKCFPLFSLKKASEGKLGQQATGKHLPTGLVEQPGSDMEASPTGK